MAKKIRKNYTIDAGTVKKFMDICDKNDKEYSATVEKMMEDYIARDGEIMMDDIYAPRMEGLVSRTIDKGFDRIASMLYNINVDVTAGLYSHPTIYKQVLLGMERTINEYVNEQLLNENRESKGEKFKVGDDGERVIHQMRQFARSNITERTRKQKEYKKEKREQANA